MLHLTYVRVSVWETNIWVPLGAAMFTQLKESNAQAKQLGQCRPVAALCTYLKNLVRDSLQDHGQIYLLFHNEHTDVLDVGAES